MDNLNTITNKDIKKIGFWIRPDENIGGCNYDKLVLLNKYHDIVYSWQTEDKMFSYLELSTNTFVLNFREDKRLWTIQSSSPDCNIVPPLLSGEFDKSELLEYDGCGVASRKYMDKMANSMLDYLELYDVSWTRMHNVNELFFENYEGKDIVWKVEKHWTQAGEYAKSESIEKTIWLSDFAELSDGTLKWTATAVSCYEDPANYIKRYDEFIAGTIVRPTASKPYETCLWIADIPVFFDFPSKLAALHNTKHLCLSYINNNPLAIKYVVAEAVPRKMFELMQMKEREWNVYQQYIPGNETVLYNDSYPHFANV